MNYVKKSSAPEIASGGPSRKGTFFGKQTRKPPFFSSRHKVVSTDSDFVQTASDSKKAVIQLANMKKESPGPQISNAPSPFIARSPIRAGTFLCSARTRIASLAHALSLSSRFPGWPGIKPDCPCHESTAIANTATWEPDANPLLWYHHPGASSSFRSKHPTSAGHGQQCTYDSSGDLITHGAGAGTPDVVSPIVSQPRHFAQDVIPWECLGSSLYNRYWVPNRGIGCAPNP